MSTLSEIAANHANTAKALEAQSAMMRGLCSSAPQVFERLNDLPAAQTAEQIAPHTFAVSNDSLGAQAVSLSY